MKVDFTIPSVPIILAIIFMLLKLWGVITWSWFWVLSPLFIPVLLCIGIVVLTAVLTILYYTVYKLFKHIIKIFEKK